MSSADNQSILSDPTYRIESEIGSGGGGVVYKAWHTRLQKYVVIKELKHGSKNDIETQRNEVEALKNVKSEYLPQVFDFLSEGDRVFTVMEFIEGESLDKLIKSGQKFTQQQVMKWYYELASALTVIHKQKVCHRDIKPANIMVTPNGSVCLIDFNAALVSGNDVRLVSRSLGYASPEQYNIYEKFKGLNNAPINYNSSSVKPMDIAQENQNRTELNPDDSLTELVTSEIDPGKTVLVTTNVNVEQKRSDIDSNKTEFVIPDITSGIDWQRSDIYSLAATMYHLLTGIRPPQRASEVKPISEYGRFSEGIVYIIEKSMQIQPSERFLSVLYLQDAIINIHKYDMRWKASQAKKIAAAVILPLLFILFAVTAMYGSRIMAQEKEERYYSAIYSIENDGDAKAAYNEALSIHWDRIDPYRAMAERLWNEGDLDACREYIEENLGNIAEFQVISDAQRSFGDIYYILGNCYYYQAGEPDYNTARGNFEIAVQFVEDNPAYYRDYAISLARTGRIEEAEKVLEKAQVLNLDADSLNLLNGEINYAKNEYDISIEYFSKVISLSADKYMRYRAYHTTDEIFKMLGQSEKSIKLLSNAMNKIPLNRVPEMQERLADAYVKNGDTAHAIEIFEKLNENGVPKFHIMQNLAILYQNINDFDGASAILLKMTDIFPDDYRVPMRQAFLEADIQSNIENEDRDYSMTKQYYQRAVELYNKNVKAGESDPEMQQLDLLIDQLRANKWID